MLPKVGFALFAVVIFAIVLPLANAAYTSPFTNLYCATSPTGAAVVANLGACINNVIPYVIIALLISFAMVALAYLFGEVLGIQSLKGWYKGELWEAIKSLIIAASIFSVIIIFGQLATALPNCNCSASAPGSVTSFDFMYQAAYGYLAGSNPATPNPSGGSLVPGAIALVNESYNNLLGLSTGAELLKSFKVNSYFTIPFPPVPVPGVPVFGSLDVGADYQPFWSYGVLDTGLATPTSMLKETTGFLVVPMLIAVGTQLYLFIVLVQIGMGILLPLGLIFRATPFLRNIGGTLIALAITAIIVYPALLAFLDTPINLFFSPLYLNAYHDANAAYPATCGDFSWCVASPFPAYESYPPLVFSGLQANPYPGENDQLAWQYGFDAAQAAFFDSNLSPALSSMFDFAVPVVIQFILLVLDLIIGIVIAMNVARVLGGNIRLGIGKLKLA